MSGNEFFGYVEEDAFINEAMELLMKIKDEKVNRLLLKQIAVVVTE